jgi:hypothetical protein
VIAGAVTVCRDRTDFVILIMIVLIVERCYTVISLIY